MGQAGPQQEGRSWNNGGMEPATEVECEPGLDKSRRS